MERKDRGPGSILVMLLVISTFIMVVATVTLRSGTLLYEFALERVAHLSCLRATQALAYYGIAYGLMAQGDPQLRSLSFAHWPLPDGAYEGNIVIKPSKKNYLVQATLTKQGQELGTIRSEIERQKDGWRIVDWQSG